ncbi:MAG TPA: hypothetical protein VKU39_12755 [Streptosporangiaceae bacterium]|nr:hypothetical protein [Streptosporangiaceae bacterium]
MQIPVSSGQYIRISVDAPPGIDPTEFPVSIAVIPEINGEPQPADWQTATWINGEACWLKPPGGLAAGMYMAWVSLNAPPEEPVMQSGRIRIGDGGS